MDPKRISEAQRVALFRVRIAEKMRNPSGDRITPQESALYYSTTAPDPKVYDECIAFGLIRREPKGNMVLTDLGREALS